MNSVALTGTLPFPPRSISTSGGKRITHFTIAVPRQERGIVKEESDVFSCYAPEAVLLPEDLIDGVTLSIEGRLEMRAFMDSEGRSNEQVGVIVTRGEVL